MSSNNCLPATASAFPPASALPYLAAPLPVSKVRPVGASQAHDAVCAADAELIQLARLYRDNRQRGAAAAHNGSNDIGIRAMGAVIRLRILASEPVTLEGARLKAEVEADDLAA